MFLDLLKEKRLRKKLYFTVAILLICSAMTAIPVYGINVTYLDMLFGNSSMFTFLDALSGGAMARLSISGFGVSAYITASIVLQVISLMFPQIERIRKEGESGRKYMERVQLILAMAFTLVGSISLAIMCQRGNIFVHNNLASIVIAVCSWMVGAFLTIYLAQKINDYGIGNGITLLLGINILSRFPSSVVMFWKNHVMNAANTTAAVLYAFGLTLGVLLFYLITVYLERGMLRIPLVQSKKQSLILNTNGYVPMPVNIASVLPVVYASSLLALPNMFVSIFGIETEGIVSKLLATLDSTNWYTFERWYYPAGLVIYILLIIFFGFVSSRMSFSAEELADNMKKNGDVIANVKPGEETIRFFEKRRMVLTALNILFLLVIVILPELICSLLGIGGFSFIGTSLIIVIVMLTDTSMKLRAESIHNSRRHRLLG